MIEEETNKVIGFHPTTHTLVKVEMDSLPEAEPKVGIEHVQYYNPETKKIELREEERPLTQEESIEKAQKDASEALKRAQAALQGLDTLMQESEEESIPEDGVGGE